MEPEQQSTDDQPAAAEAGNPEVPATTITRQTPEEVEREYLGGDSQVEETASASDDDAAVAGETTEGAEAESDEPAADEEAGDSNDQPADESTPLLKARDAIFAMQSGELGPEAKAAADKVDSPLVCRAIANFCERAASHPNASNLTSESIDDVAMGDELARFADDDGITREDLLCLARQVVPNL